MGVVFIDASKKLLMSIIFACAMFYGLRGESGGLIVSGVFSGTSGAVSRGGSSCVSRSSLISV